VDSEQCRKQATGFLHCDPKKASLGAETRGEAYRAPEYQQKVPPQ